MANLKLSNIGYECLSIVMAELEMDVKERPDALRIAFAKGLASDTLPSDEKKDLSKFEFPSSVIAKADDKILIKHLIIEKLHNRVSDDELDKFILQFVEHGLYTMNEELKQLSSADNYLLYLLDRHNVSNK